MNLADFYLLCFAVGFLFSLLSFFVGNFHWHLPGIGAGHGHAGTGPVHGGHAAAHGTHSGGAHPPGEIHLSIFSPAILAAFLAWFGGTGYLLTRYSTVWFIIGLGIAGFSGLIGGSLIYFFMSRVLMSKDENMDSSTYEMVGVLGRISVPVREGGTGEIIYSQAGTRRTCGARAEKGEVIPKGSEIVVTRYEKGIAYVRLWSDLAEDEAPGAERSIRGPVNSTEKAKE